MARSTRVLRTISGRRTDLALRGTDSDDDDEDGSSDKLRNLPDMHVPLGLIANLSLSNKPKSGKAGKKNATEETTTLDEDDLDDDNVVRTPDVCATNVSEDLYHLGRGE